MKDKKDKKNKGQIVADEILSFIRRTKVYKRSLLVAKVIDTSFTLDPDDTEKVERAFSRVGSIIDQLVAKGDLKMVYVADSSGQEIEQLILEGSLNLVDTSATQSTEDVSDFFVEDGTPPDAAEFDFGSLAAESVDSTDDDTAFYRRVADSSSGYAIISTKASADGKVKFDVAHASWSPVNVISHYAGMDSPEDYAVYSLVPVRMELRLFAYGRESFVVSAPTSVVEEQTQEVPAGDHPLAELVADPSLK